MSSDILMQWTTVPVLLTMKIQTRLKLAIASKHDSNWNVWYSNGPNSFIFIRTDKYTWTKYCVVLGGGGVPCVAPVWIRLTHRLTPLMWNAYSEIAWSICCRHFFNSLGFLLLYFMHHSFVLLVNTLIFKASGFSIVRTTMAVVALFIYY